jgi:hypothetical protein
MTKFTLSFDFDSLDAFTQGYIEALFFADCDEPGIMYAGDGENRSEPVEVGFSALANETLEGIMADCVKFQASAAWTSLHDAFVCGALDPAERALPHNDTEDFATVAGRDFWYTRQGHGCGFWDGDWREPYASRLTEAAKAFGAVTVYLGDDGKVHLL